MRKNAPIILVAEDDERFRRELGKYLHARGFAVVCAEDGYQALDFAIRDRPDLMILDVHMPAGDGFSVYERVQRHPELAVTPVIYMTHDHSPEVLEDAREDDALALLYKPFELPELLAHVQTALGTGGAQAA